MDTNYLISQFRATPERLRALAAGLSPQQACYKPAADDWSILEVLNHLVDEEIHDFRSHLDFILDPAGKEWEAIDPQGWVTERKYNERDLGQTLDNFQRERAASIAWLDSLGDIDWDTVYTSEFGSMRAGDMFSCWVAHDGLHLRQLAELHRAILEQAVGEYDISYAGDW
jgi:hypothetical protein